MKKKNYLFKGVSGEILSILANECKSYIQTYIERIEFIDAQIKLSPLEAMAARKQINDLNKKCGTKLRLLKMKD